MKITFTKHFAATGLACLLVATFPVQAQQEVNPGQQQVERDQQQLNRDPQTAQPLPPSTRDRSAEIEMQRDLQQQREAQAAKDQMQRDVATTGPFVDEPAGARPIARNWSWLGLLGLLGLMGLRCRHDVYDREHRPISPE